MDDPLFLRTTPSPLPSLHRRFQHFNEDVSTRTSTSIGPSGLDSSSSSSSLYAYDSCDQLLRFHSQHHPPLSSSSRVYCALHDALCCLQHVQPEPDHPDAVEMGPPLTAVPLFRSYRNYGSLYDPDRRLQADVMCMLLREAAKTSKQQCPPTHRLLLPSTVSEMQLRFHPHHVYRRWIETVCDHNTNPSTIKRCLALLESSSNKNKSVDDERSESYPLLLFPSSLSLSSLSEEEREHETNKEDLLLVLTLEWLSVR
jgi:hypothetical protein